MDEYLYNAYDRYFSALCNTGYYPQKGVTSLLVLNFIFSILRGGLAGYLKDEDYFTIDRALDCLYGSNCLLPYPYSLGNTSGGSIHNGVLDTFSGNLMGSDSFAEMLTNMQSLYNTNVIKNKQLVGEISDVVVPIFSGEP